MNSVRLSLLALFLLVTSPVTNAAPFSERDAFCQDQVRNRFFSQYEMQKAYNRCMENADRLIQSYEQDKIRQAEQDRIKRERWKREAEERKAAELKKQRNLEASRAAEREKAAGHARAQCPKPDYPPGSRRNEEEGDVTLKFLIDDTGRIVQSEIEKSSGFSRLDEAARKALAQCEFSPAIVNGKPAESWESIKYTFRYQ